MGAAPDRTWRLLPSERVLWEGGPKLGVARDLSWNIGALVLGAIALIALLFAGLLRGVGLPGASSMAFAAVCCALTACGVRVWPSLLADSCRYMLTDRQVIWRRGALRRTIDRSAITYGRIHWHRSVPGVGHLELVRAVPFGPLARRQRLWLHDIEGPDILYALIRDAQPHEFAGYADVGLTDRLDQGERVLWGASPAGWRMGHAEAWTAVVGVAVLGCGLWYGQRMSSLLLHLERSGLPVVSRQWIMLFAIMVLSAGIIVGVGVALLWHGLWGARAGGSRTEYVLTQSRLLIRRGRTELSIDRRRIVDVAEVPSTNGSRNLHLILDAPDARALEASGALDILPMPRSVVAPVLYEVTDLELVRALLLAPPSEPPPPSDRAAA